MAVNAPPQGTNIPRGNSNTGEITPANNGKVPSRPANANAIRAAKQANRNNNRKKTKYTDLAYEMRQMIYRISKLVSRRDLKKAAIQIKELKNKIKKTISDFHADVRPLLRQLKRNNVKNMKYGFLGFKTPKVMKMDQILYDLNKKVAQLPPPPVRNNRAPVVVGNNKKGFFRRAKNTLQRGIGRMKNRFQKKPSFNVPTLQQWKEQQWKKKGFFGRMKNRYVQSRENAQVKRMLKNIRNATGQIYNVNKNTNSRNNLGGATTLQLFREVAPNMSNKNILNRIRHISNAAPNMSNKNILNLRAKHIANAARNASLKSLN